MSENSIFGKKITKKLKKYYEINVKHNIIDKNDCMEINVLVAVPQAQLTVRRGK